MFRGKPSLVLLGASMCLLACGAVYPELSTPIRPASNRTLEPPPPDELLFIKFTGAEIPSRTRDGRQWDTVGGSAPDPFAKVFVDDKEIIATPVQANTLKPTWPDQRKGNYWIRKGATVRVELWDSNPINNHPICRETTRDIHAESSSEHDFEMSCDSGASMLLAVQPAHAKVGIGLYYEIRTYGDAWVTRVVKESPAGRAHVVKGDQLLSLDGKPAKQFDEDSFRSLVNANSAHGVTFGVRHANGKEETVTLKDGPLYPTIDEEIKVE
jgi:hypothetical protein